MSGSCSSGSEASSRLGCQIVVVNEVLSHQKDITEHNDKTEIREALTDSSTISLTGKRLGLDCEQRAQTQVQRMDESRSPQ